MANQANKTALLHGPKDLKKALSSLRERGFADTLRYIPHVLTWRFHTYVDRHYDRTFNVDTTSHVNSWDLHMKSEGDDIGDEEPMYLPTSSLAFKSILANLPRDLSDFVFIDYGSGKGRTLLLAADYKFKKVIGVEFAAELHQLAQENIANYRNADRQCLDLVSLHGDATRYDLPDEACVLYFFNPFEEAVMRKVLQRIARSYRQRRRKLYLVYYKPKFPRVLLESDFLVQKNRRRPVFRMPLPYDLMIFETRDP